MLRVPGIPERLAAQAARVRPRACAGSTWRSRRASPRRSTGRRRSRRSARDELDAEIVEQTLGSVLKYHEDFEAVRDAALPRSSRRRALSAEPIVRQVVTFGRVLREAGLEVGPGRISDAMTGLDAVGLERRDDVYWTLRQTLVSRADDVESFDRAFAAWFLRAPELAPPRTPHVAAREGGRVAPRRRGRGRRGGARTARSAPSAGAARSCCAARTSPR